MIEWMLRNRSRISVHITKEKGLTPLDDLEQQIKTESVIKRLENFCLYVHSRLYISV